MQHDSLIRIIASAILLTAVACSAALTTALSAEAGRAQLVYTDVAEEGDPPEVAIGIAMGAFRGLFVNYLWIRATKLKEDGKFYEAIELSDAITRLQPRFPRVWAFHAWNMSYNISVATNTARERWMWVKAGIDLLRTGAIPRNPNDVLLHKELAWIFIHKIQGWADDANHFYKRELAREWTIALGQPPSRQEAQSRDDAIAAMVDFLTPIVLAPNTVEGVIERERSLSASVEAADEAGGSPNPTAAAAVAPGAVQPSLVRELVDRIEKESGLKLDFDLLRFIEYHRAAKTAWYVDELGFQLDPQSHNEAISALLDDPKYERAWELLVPHVRKRVLIEDYNMEPERMVRYTRTFGPLDWRHPAAHSLFWSVRGVEQGLERVRDLQFDILNTDRVTLHSIQELFRFGDIQYDLLTDEYYTLPDLDYTDTYKQVLDSVRDRAGIADDPARGFRLYSAGYENFLREVIRVYYNRGEPETAEYYHALLRRGEWRNTNDPDVDEELTALTLKEFVDKQLEDRISVPHVAVSEIESALTIAFVEGILQRKPKVFKAQMEYAYIAWQRFRAEQSTRTMADPDTLRMLEFVGEHFSVIVERVLSRLLMGGRIGVGGNQGIGPFQAAALFRAIPSDMQRLVYDELRARLTASGFEPERFAELFPEPVGMEEYRNEREQGLMKSDVWMRRQLEFKRQ